MAAPRILIVRLGAMGDILHTLPAAWSMKRSFPNARIAWAVHPKWTDLLQGGGVADEVIAVDRKRWKSLAEAWRTLRNEPFDTVIDCQGLIQSALVAKSARSGRVIGFASPAVREKPAAWFYTAAVEPRSQHMVERIMELAVAAGAREQSVEFPLPAGKPEGDLPEGAFVLASPLAGWRSKQWPVEHYARLAELLTRELGLPLVLNGAPRDAAALRSIPNIVVHISSVAGLIDATRRAAAVVGLDSGPMHLAAALGKPGVALYGPTDPARNGPYSKTIAVLRQADAPVSYKRENKIHPSMRALTPEMVFDALRKALEIGAGAPSKS
jgi:heptosyltransferase-1